MSDYLPPEVITLILRRLPVESVVKCTAVCKSWYALIKHPSFISTHLQAAALQDNLLFSKFLRDHREIYHLRHYNDTFEEYKHFLLPFSSDFFGYFRIVGTCNGLICLAKVAEPSWNIILWNPSIHKHLILPSLDLPKSDLPFGKFYETALGFGFDSVSGDYKVLLVLPKKRGESSTEVWLFSLNRRSWTRRREVSTDHNWSECEHAVFVKSTLYFPGYCWNLKDGFSSHMILAFDITTEKFYVINYPETLAHTRNQMSPHIWILMSLIKYEESNIAVVSSHGFEDLDDPQQELWVMKECGKNTSWTKMLHSIDENGRLVFDTGLADVFEVRRNGEVLLKVRGEHGRHGYDYELATLNLNCHQPEQQLKRIIGIRVEFGDRFVGSFVESLVLLDKGEEDTEGAV